MRTFAQNQNQPQKRVSSSLARSNMATSGPNHHTHPILNLQRTIGNQAMQRLLQTNAEELKAGLTGMALPRFGHDYSRIPIHPLAAGAIQTKLAINKPGDEYEQEADRVADQVMRVSEPQLQRACACGGACPKCRTEQPSQEHERLQIKRVQASDSGQTAVPPIVHEVLASLGQPLDLATRDFMEPRYGHDLSRVRVHTDTRATDAARQVNARAFTVGHDIVFGAGQYAPATSSGRWLLAHELTHVMQQQEGSQSKSGHVQARGIQRQPDATEADCVNGRVLRWGCDTVCSHNGFWDDTLTPAHEDERCCNMWPPFVEEFARQNLNLNGAASCRGAARRSNNQIATVTHNGRAVRVLCTDAFGRGRDHEIELSPLAMMDLHGSFNNIRSAHVCYEDSEIGTCSEAHARRGNQAHPEEEHCISNHCTRDEATRRSCRVDFGWPNA